MEEFGSKDTKRLLQQLFSAFAFAGLNDLAGAFNTEFQRCQDCQLSSWDRWKIADTLADFFEVVIAHPVLHIGTLDPGCSSKTGLLSFILSLLSSDLGNEKILHGTSGDVVGNITNLGRGSDKEKGSAKDKISTTEDPCDIQLFLPRRVLTQREVKTQKPQTLPFWQVRSQQTGDDFVQLECYGSLKAFFSIEDRGEDLQFCGDWGTISREQVSIFLLKW